MARPKRVDIKSIIACLTSNDSNNLLERTNHLFNFLGFMEYPSYSSHARLVSDLYRVMYFAKIMGNDKYPHLNCEQLGQLLQRSAILIREIPRDSAVDYLFLPEATHVNKMWAVEIVRFILSYRPPTDRLTDQASLKKAYFVFSRGGFGYTVPQELVSSAWSILRTSAAFHYVNTRCQSRFLSLRPDQKDLEQRITEILSNSLRLRQFFSQSLWVQNRVSKILYLAAFRGVSLPELPDDIKEEVPRQEPVDQSVQETMKEYSARTRDQRGSRRK